MIEYFKGGEKFQSLTHVSFLDQDFAIESVLDGYHFLTLTESNSHSHGFLVAYSQIRTT